MDLRLKEITWLRLVSLLMWTLLVMVKRGVSQLIDALESRVFDRSDQTPKEKEVGAEPVVGATLLPPLSDELVLTKIWPLLHRRVNVSLMWRLRRVSRDWKKSVAQTLEWAALEVVRVDSPGYIQFLKNRGERRPSLQERVEDELRSIVVLLSECLVEYAPRAESVQYTVENFKPDDEGPNSAEGSVEQVDPCMWMGFPCTGEIESEVDSEQGEREEIEIESTASTGSSLRVYYPRHQFRD
jgi:hypothetical protein